MTSNVALPVPSDSTHTKARARARTEARPHILNLPYDIHIEIFSHVSWKTHVACMEVCTYWRQILTTPHARAKRFETDSEPRIHGIFKSVFMQRTSVLHIAYRNGGITSARFKKSIDYYDDSHYLNEDRVLWGLELWNPRHPILDDRLFFQGDVKDPMKESADFYQPSISGFKVDIEIEKRSHTLASTVGTWPWKKFPNVRSMTLGDCISLITTHVIGEESPAATVLDMELFSNGIDDLSFLTIRMRLWRKDSSRN
ncbi:hypothetical protein TWF730_008244 [Orbilia blumenaviensis]|uniref:F-box domain-containing protein n=1 Tax=Orbilia blumenaviensis TaxID=1796055 RepID=A0AAV9V2L9_9PEZI